VAKLDLISKYLNGFVLVGFMRLFYLMRSLKKRLTATLQRLKMMRLKIFQKYQTI